MRSPSSTTAADSSERPEVSLARDRELRLGLIMAMIAALGYTGTNIALRGVTRDGDFDWAIWVTCLKSLPGALIAWGLVARGRWRDESMMPSLRVVLLLLATGILTQIGGNVLFQLALAMCGLALAVPTVFATLMVAGALLGRFVLGEAITPRGMMATSVLMGAIGLLSLGAAAAGLKLPPGPPNFSQTGWVLLGISLAGIAGVFYGVLGVVIRRATRGTIPLATTLALVGTTGVIGLGVPALARLGMDAFRAPLWESALMIAAGTMNGAAFFAMGGALRRVPVMQVNLINASQAALCALGGVLVYNEALSWGLIGGILLTVAGLMLLDRGPQKGKVLRQKPKHTPGDPPPERIHG